MRINRVNFFKFLFQLIKFLLFSLFFLALRFFINWSIWSILCIAWWSIMLWMISAGNIRSSWLKGSHLSLVLLSLKYLLLCFLILSHFFLIKLMPNFTKWAIFRLLYILLNISSIWGNIRLKTILRLLLFLFFKPILF